MIVWVIRDGKWVQYERLGECLACGDCCSKFEYSLKHTTVSIMNPNGDDNENGQKRDINKWENWAVENWDDNDKWVWWGPLEITPLDKSPCHLFDPETNYCAGFGRDDWREICRKFPFRVEDLEGLENCGFTFREVI